MSAFYSHLLMLQAFGQVKTVGGAVTVSDDQGRTVVGFGFQKGAQRLSVLGAEGDGGDVDVAVGHGNDTEVLFCRRPAGDRELRRRAQRRRFGLLSAGIGIDLGVQDQDVDVAVRRQDVIQAAVADVVSPAIAADDPHALWEQVIGHDGETARSRIIDQVGKVLLEKRHLRAP